MSQNFDDLRSPAAPQERQEQQQTSQHPPPHQQITQQPSIQQQQQSAYSTWMPLASTNRFPPPRIYEFTPESSLEGDTLQVSLTMPSLELMQSLRLALGCCIMPTQAVLVNTATHFLTLSSLIPNWQLTQTSDRLRVPLFVVVCNQNQEVIDNWFVGYFAYDFARKRTSIEYELGVGTSKRPRRTGSTSSGSALPGEDTTAAIAAAYIVPPPEQAYSSYYTPSYSGPQPPPQLSPPGYHSYPGYYGMQQPSYPSPHPPHAASQPSGPPQMAPPGMGPREYFEGQTVAPAQMMNIALEPIAPTTPTPASGPRQAGIPLEPIGHVPPSHPHPSHHHPQPHEHALHPAPHAIAPAVTSAPQIIAPATATAAPTGPSTTGHIPPPAPTPPDPFANIPNKATLRLEGDLDSMLINWTEQECEEHRRVVQFWRRQEGNEVICSFAPVSDPEARRQEHNILVSCIYWQERGDYFITSVDCISLLESLIGVKFTVEEKNRIRRNLEGFRPLTVSKLKPDSAEFFKLIMGFSNPKPRNIEKDVKVFPWTKLGEALRKIISKYTASYSSTAAINVDNPPLPQPPSEQQQQQ